MSSIYKNCLITQKDSEIKKEYSPYKHNSVDIWADKIYSPFYGIVIAIDNMDSTKLHRVIIQYSGYVLLAFYNLKEVYVEAGSKVVKNELIGLADKYVSLEFLSTLDPSTAQNHTSVFTNSIRLFRYDPNLILNGYITISDPEEVN